MSTIKVIVTPLSDLRPHPGADALDLATVGGWQMCVKRGSYKSGDPVVYFEPGTVLPPEVAERFGVKNYLSLKTDIDGQRVLVVHRVKLRGEPSFGLVVPPEPGMQLGQDVAATYGAVKFRPPVKTRAGDAEADHPRFFAYTDIENMRSYPTVIRDDEEVVATEKIHGTNCRIGFVRDSLDGATTMLPLAGSRSLRRRAPPPDQWPHNTYWAPHTSDGVARLFHDLYAAGSDGCTLYGEVFGKGVQSYTYGTSVQKFRAFDLSINGRYVDYDQFKAYCEKYGIAMAPLVYRGPFSLARIKALSDGPSLVGGAHGREGVVVRPVVERDDPQVGRVILKYIGDAYLFGKAAEEDSTDV